MHRADCNEDTADGNCGDKDSDCCKARADKCKATQAFTVLGNVPSVPASQLPCLQFHLPP